MSINLQEIGQLFKTKVNAAVTDASLRLENSELREKWNHILEACCNAESEVEHLQDQAETLELKLTDANEIYHRQVAECSCLSMELNSIKLINTKEKADLETRIAGLLKENTWVKSCYAYVMDYKKEQDKLISDLKPVVEKLRQENTTLKSQQVNSEHLAKQVVKLQAELSELEMTYCPYQKNKGGIDLPCGTCVKCKLDTAYGIIDRTQANVELVEKERDKAERATRFTKNILEETTKNLVAVNEKITRLEENYQHSQDCLTQQLTVNVRLERQLHKSKAALINISEASFFTNKKELAKTALASL